MKGSLIGKGVIIAAAFYIVLMVIEAAIHPQIILPAVIGSVLFAGLAGVFLWKNEHAVHKGEVIVMWTMVLLFVVYGLVYYFIGGVYV